VNKTELVEKIADSAGISRSDATTALNTVFDAISKSLEDGDQVNLAGFGTFLVRQRAARTGRNPQTGATIQIAASKQPAFKPGKALKDAVN